MITPNRDASLQAVSAFLPKAGWTYASGRNYDLHDDHPPAVSQLSPYLRHRLVTEAELLQAVTSEHDITACEKFVQEVFWRTYWKGWLQLRPGIWDAYLQDLRAAENRLQTEAGLRAAFDAACTGKTEVCCFNYWSQQLVNHGYLHNHARMWFASIWVFTLRLPWALGADFFMRHLLDGDPASNTLSWRWVAGMQTRGKTYLATPDNIEKFTYGRFRPAPGQLAKTAIALATPEPPKPQPIAPPPPPSDGAMTGWLIHEDDMSMAPVHDVPVCGLSTVKNRSPLAMSARVIDFADSALSNVLGPNGPIFHDIDAVANWAVAQKLDQIITPFAPVGPTARALRQLEKRLAPEGITLSRQIRDYDLMCWPHATKGFFKFKEHIPDFLKKI